MTTNKNKRREPVVNDDRDPATMVTMAHGDGQGETTTVPLRAFREVWEPKGWYEAEPSTSDADSEESVPAPDENK